MLSRDLKLWRRTFVSVQPNCEEGKNVGICVFTCLRWADLFVDVYLCVDVYVDVVVRETRERELIHFGRYLATIF